MREKNALFLFYRRMQQISTNSADIIELAFKTTMLTIIKKEGCRMKTCCFTGHRPHNLGYGENSIQCDELKSKLEELIRKLIEEEGVTHFISGVALGVDTYAANIVLELKSEYSDITLECAIPWENQAAKWNERDREIYYDLISKCDKETLLQQRYSNDCLQKRNEYMVDKSDFIIAVWNGKPSGTGNTVKYAQKKNKAVLIINPQMIKGDNI